MVSRATQGYFAITLALFLVPLQLSWAQFDFAASDFSSYQPELVFEPATPEPGEKVEVSIGNFVSALQGSTITWQHNDVALETFTNQPKAMFVAGSLGTTDQLSAVLRTPAGQTVEVTGSVASQYLDIIIEPQTHVPNFYEGRALPSAGSQVNVTALLNGQAATEFIYAWQVNGDLLGGASTRAQYRTSFTMPMDSQVVLSLDVLTLAGTLVASKSVLVPSVRPQVRFYEVHALYGISPNTFDSLLLTGNSATVRAVPYYLDTRVFNFPDVLDWQLNGNPVTAINNPYEITVERNFGSGVGQLSFQVQSTSALLQGARGSIPVNY